MQKLTRPLLIAYFVVSNLLMSCNKDDEQGKLTYQVPDTYSFENVKYSGQTARILLLDSLNKLVNAAKGVKVTEQQLLDIYENKNSLYASINDGKVVRLSDKNEASADAQVRAWFKLVDQYSGTQPGAKWLITPEDELDLNQLIQKTMMGSVLYYQATATYLIDRVPTADNNTIVPGEGTAMQHYWDEAFGYFGAPKDFTAYTEADLTSRSRDTNGDGKIDPITEKPYYHANYALQRDMASKNFSAADRTDYMKQLMGAFTKGRAAIINKDYAARDEAKQVIVENLEKLIASNTLHYINSVKQYMLTNKQSDIAARNHEWAEARGFLNSLKYNPLRKISDADWNELNGYIGNKPGETNADNLGKAAKKLQSIYGFTEFQASNLRLAAE
jgi:hypothetical protein